MSGYKCVNYTELCRLCTSSNGQKTDIFSDECKNKNICNKILECLRIKVSEKDKLPKTVCANCLKQVEQFSDFRDSCTRAQGLLESCLNSTKLKNGGMVYIKDDNPKELQLPIVTTPTVKIVHQAPQSQQQTHAHVVTSVQQATMAPIIINTMPKTLTHTSQANNSNTHSFSTNSDFLSSIIQAVGIQQSEENSESQQQNNQVAQYTITLDGQTIKTNQIHYKIQETNQQGYMTTSTANDDQQTAYQQVDEFLKLKTPIKTPIKKEFPDKAKTDQNAKKPKINLVLKSPVQTTPQKQTIFPVVSSTPVTSPQMQTTTKSIQLKDLQLVPSKNCMVPIVLQSSDKSGDQQNHQIITQLNVDGSNNFVPNIAYVQMKIQPNENGQPVVRLTPAQIPATLQLAPQTIPQYSIQTIPQAQIQQVQQPTQQPVQQTQPQTQQIQQSQPQTIQNYITMVEKTTSQTQTQTTSTETIDMSEEFENEEDEDGKDDSLIKIEPADGSAQSSSPISSDLQSAQSHAATQQMKAITSQSTKQELEQTGSTSVSLTVCDVCKKEFKRKEHLLQHLKSHVGLRPFKCGEAGCNKSFSRKEHLMRHLVSHTGKKMFSCDMCHKLFSRKDNLNKHKKTHQENQGVAPYLCQICNKGFFVKSQFMKHKAMHDAHGANILKSPPKKTPIKVKVESVETTQSQPQQQTSQPQSQVVTTISGNTTNAAKPQILTQVMLPTSVNNGSNQINQKAILKTSTTESGQTVYTIHRIT